MVTVYCKNTGTSLSVQEGTMLLELIDKFDFDRPYPILSAKVNNVSEGLKFRVYNSRDVEFLDYRSYAGRNTYCRSLSFLLCKSAMDVLPGCSVRLRRPVSKGYYCDIVKPDGSELSDEDVARINGRMHEIVDQDMEFHRHDVHLEDAVEMFRQMGYEDKVKILETSGKVFINYYTLGGTPDYFYDCLVPSAGYLPLWELKKYFGGMLLRVPDRHEPEKLAPFFEQPKTFEVFQETERWNKIMGLSNVGDVNMACQKGHAQELIQVSEALQDKKIVKIAEEIYERYNSSVPVRIVLITGPSSSGKTTFCKKLSVQLKACGLRPLFFSTDDYFVNRVDTPKLPDGSYDFDAFDTVDHAYLERDVMKYMAGEEVNMPEYNFVTGLREYNGKKIRKEDGAILLIEGIHALNPQLIPNVDPSVQYKVFINTITSISLDDHNCIPTSDNRLLRRIVRDANKGAFTPVETIRQWPNVRRSEVKWIYPFQETADVLFNSAYLVEFAVLRNHAEQILGSVPKNCPEYSDANKLLKFLSFFSPVPLSEIPSTSLLREFVGGSSLLF